MDAFKLANDFTKKWEKGLVDHPADPGGITKNGVSLRFLQGYETNNKAWLKEIGIKLPVDAASIRALTEEQEEKIFKKAFWLPLIPESFPLKTVVTLYDASVNHGQKQAVKFLQRACNQFPGEQLTVDGIIGPKTRNRAKDLTDISLANLCIEYRDVFYRDLVNNKPSNSVFLKGWLNRTTDLRKYIAGIK